jgi:hypothetical protein
MVLFNNDPRSQPHINLISYKVASRLGVRD